VHNFDKFMHIVGVVFGKRRLESSAELTVRLLSTNTSYILLLLYLGM